MTAQEQLEDRLRQAAESTLSQNHIQRRLISWVDAARDEAMELGLQSTPVASSHVAQALPGTVFSAAGTTITDPATGGVWNLQAILFARNEVGKFGQSHGVFELYRIVCDEEGRAVEHLSALKFEVVSTPEFEPQSVSNVWPSALAGRLEEHLRTAAQGLFDDGSKLAQFQLALQDALTP